MNKTLLVIATLFVLAGLSQACVGFQPCAGAWSIYERPNSYYDISFTYAKWDSTQFNVSFSRYTPYYNSVCVNCYGGYYGYPSYYGYPPPRATPYGYGYYPGYYSGYYGGMYPMYP